MTKDWKRRYVTIKDGRIFYYKTFEVRQRSREVSTM
jgi:hypothetical protein